MLFGPTITRNLNKLHDNTMRCVIYDIPVGYNYEVNPAPETVNALITGFVLPGLKIKYSRDSKYRAISHIPMQEDNDYDDNTITISMIADDRLENWWTINRYMETIQSGFLYGYPERDMDSRLYGVGSNPNPWYRNRLMYTTIDLIQGDDSMQKWNTIRLERCFPVGLDDIPYNSTSSNGSPVTFNVSFVYGFRQLKHELESEDCEKPKSILD